MEKIISSLLIVVALIHLLPATGVIGSELLTSLYKIPIQESNLLILMRHRAVLFGILGVLFFYAAFNQAFQPIAIGAGIVSTASFIWIALSVGGYNVAIHKVVVSDVVALLCLLISLGLYLMKYKSA